MSNLIGGIVDSNGNTKFSTNGGWSVQKIATGQYHVESFGEAISLAVATPISSTPILVSVELQSGAVVFHVTNTEGVYRNSEFHFMAHL